MMYFFQFTCFNVLFIGKGTLQLFPDANNDDKKKQ